MAHNFARPDASQFEQQLDLLHDNPPNDASSRKPPPLVPSSRRAAVVSPTFHFDPERSSSSDNGSLAHPFPFPNAPYPLPPPARDSVTTHHSSIYPHSTSSYSANSPPSPSSPSSGSFAASIRTGGTDGDTTSQDPHHPHNVLFDPDDVSYRLRLLVRNNYFLPPAHSKPSQSELAGSQPPAGIANAKSGSLRDIFRVGKPKSSTLRSNAPTSQQAPTRNARDIVGPPLRQVKSANAIARPSHTRNPTNLSASQTSSRALSVTATGGGPVERRGRVVVIREKVEDIAIAAKEAEIQMRVQQQTDNLPRPKSAGDRRGSSRKSVVQDGFEDDLIIDPTDAVDLPSYSFQPQASGLDGMGLGVDASGLSAGVLADQLPPPGSPDLGMSKEDMLWRKALLHQAVGLSMMSIPAPTSSSSANSTPDQKRTRKPSSSPLAGTATSSAVQFSSAPAGNSNSSKLPVQPILEDLAVAVGSTSPSNARKRERKDSTKGANATAGDGAGRGRSLTHLVPPKSPSTTHPLPVNVHAFRARPSSRHRASPAPQRSETPGFSSQPLQPPPRKGSSGLRPSEPTIPGSPYSEHGENDYVSAISGQQRSDEGLNPPRNHSPLFPPSGGAHDTIRRTLGQPLLSEGYETEHTTRSSDYFTPFAPSVILQDPDGDGEGLAKPLRPSRSAASVTSGSFYSGDEDERAEGGDELHDMQTSISRSETPSFRRARSPLMPFSPIAPTERTSGSRPSNDSGNRTRQSHDSSAVSSSNAPRASIADSHVSMFSSSFGPRKSYSRSPAPGDRTSEEAKPPPPTRSRRASDELVVQAPPAALLATAGSDIGLHSLGGVGELRPSGGSSAIPIPRPHRSATNPEPSNLASRRSQLLRPLDLLSTAALGPSLGVRSAPAVERDQPNISSFLDFDMPSSMQSWRDADWSDGGGDREAFLYLDALSEPRSRVPSNAATIVPSSMKHAFAAMEQAEEPAHPPPSDPQPIMRFPNSSNPFLQAPFAGADPNMPVTNTPPTRSGGSFLSSLGNLGILGGGKGASIASRDGDFRKKGAETSHSLLRYAMDPRAKSTPTLSPSSKITVEVPPGRRSNVSGSRGRYGHVLVIDGFESPTEDRGEGPSQWPTSPNPEVAKLDGMLAQHMQAERDLLKRVARGAARGDRP